MGYRAFADTTIGKMTNQAEMFTRERVDLDTRIEVVQFILTRMTMRDVSGRGYPCRRLRSPKMLQ